MNAVARRQDRYALSFTSGALLVREAVIVVPLYLDLRDWSSVRTQLNAENLLQARTTSSAKRLIQEVVQRLTVLTDDELVLLQDASPSERGHLMWVAACRRYTFVGDFAEEIVRGRFLLLTPELSYEDFDSFVRSKSLWHPELAQVTSSTLKKLRSTLFQMIKGAGLLSDGAILHAPLSDRVRDALNAQVPSDVRYFPTRDNLEVAS